MRSFGRVSIALFALAGSLGLFRFYASGQQESRPAIRWELAYLEDGEFILNRPPAVSTLIRYLEKDTLRTEIIQVAPSPAGLRTNSSFAAAANKLMEQGWEPLQAFQATEQYSNGRPLNPRLYFRRQITQTASDQTAVQAAGQ